MYRFREKVPLNEGCKNLSVKDGRKLISECEERSFAG
jgi:hypothetical protein